MRTPVILVAGQDHTDEVTGALLRRTGTVVVEHRFDGHVVRRMTATLSRGELITTEDALEFAHGCVSCTIRDDLLVLLRRLHRRDNVVRIVVHLAPWLEPQPICWAIDHVRVCVGHGYPDGPAALDVRVAAVVTCVDCVRWLPQSLGEDELPDGRTVAQVTVGQAEFADLLVLTHPEPVAVAVLRRLALERESPAASTASSWRWRIWTTTHGGVVPIPRTRHCWRACLRWQPTVRLRSWNSVPAARFTRNVCMPRLTCCSMAWFALEVGCGWPTGRIRSCGSNQPVAVCGSHRPESGWRRWRPRRWPMSTWSGGCSPT